MKEIETDTYEWEMYVDMVDEVSVGQEIEDLEEENRRNELAFEGFSSC